jgi:hypothetical protein
MVVGRRCNACQVLVDVSHRCEFSVVGYTKPAGGVVSLDFDHEAVYWGASHVVCAGVHGGFSQRIAFLLLTVFIFLILLSIYHVFNPWSSLLIIVAYRLQGEAIFSHLVRFSLSPPDAVLALVCAYCRD